ncbi:uncharacterized protein LOC108462150 [Gossypium arboreum]|uniref:uncharacterized protein LOC108462150 n=1 Tax=Gossypium arboreum TaxID=29729 RepID=UPI000818F41D|nr:uncharacterized protein LOC108462150 [Gossypium arboreum]
MNDAKSVLKFLHKNTFTKFGTPRALISDEGSYFDCKLVANARNMYDVKHIISTSYHPQTNGQFEVSNREIEQILEKVVNPTHKDWSSKLDEAFWAYHTIFKTPLGMSHFWIVYGKPYHLLLELEHKTYWAIKKLNMDLSTAGINRLLELNEMKEFRAQAYENAKMYKEKTKRWHDNKILPRHIMAQAQSQVNLIPHVIAIFSLTSYPSRFTSFLSSFPFHLLHPSLFLLHKTVNASSFSFSIHYFLSNTDDLSKLDTDDEDEVPINQLKQKHYKRIAQKSVQADAGEVDRQPRYNCAARKSTQPN